MGDSRGNITGPASSLPCQANDVKFSPPGRDIPAGKAVSGIGGVSLGRYPFGLTVQVNNMGIKDELFPSNTRAMLHIHPLPSGQVIFFV